MSLVKKNHLDMGFAFDGDADRCIAVSEDGRIIDGDIIMYILSKRFLERGSLAGDTLVATVMSNKGLFSALDEIGVKYELTSVGDRFVYERMQDKGYCLGGEQSGHVIIKKYATTGDGILTALMLCEEVCDKKTSLCSLAKPVTIYPQITKSIYVSDKDKVMNDDVVINTVKRIEEDLGNNGRILLRKSGTEPVIRIMAECKTDEECNGYIDEITLMLRNRGYTDEQ